MTKLCKGTSGFDPNYESVEGHLKFLKVIKEKQKKLDDKEKEMLEKEQFELNYPLKS